jgi:hypothetical protein
MSLALRNVIYLSYISFSDVDDKRQPKSICSLSQKKQFFLFLFSM